MDSDYSLLRGDCLNKMGFLDEGSVDMVLVDLPYGTTACDWDAVIPFEPLWANLKRLAKSNAIFAFTAAQPFTTDLINSNRASFKYTWVWDKHIPRGFQSAKYKPMNKHEDIVIFGSPKSNYFPIMVERDKPVTVKNYKKKGRSSSNDIGQSNDPGKSFTYTHRNPDTIITGCWEPNAGKVHPTQKPVALMEYLIRTYTKEGDMVLDCCMGSGSTGVAAIRTGRKFIGIEKDEAYYDAASQRIQDAYISKGA
jgi:site-specific DNA-methyltransferase (adenine-specific)